MLATQVYEWVPANLMLGVTLRWTSTTWFVVFLLVFLFFNLPVLCAYLFVRYYDILRNAGTYVMVKSLRRNFEV